MKKKKELKNKKIVIEGPVFPLLLLNDLYKAAYVTDKLRIRKLKKVEIKSEKEPTRMLNKSIKNILENEKLRNIIAITFILAFLGYLL